MTGQYNRRISAFFSILSAAVFFFAFAARGQSVVWDTSSGYSGLAAFFAIVTDDGRVLIYHTENPKLADELAAGKKYRVFYKGSEAGTIEITEVKSTYSTAKVIAGKLNLNLEGKTLELVDFTHEYKVIPDEIKNDLKTLKVKNVIPAEPRHGGMVVAAGNGAEKKQAGNAARKTAAKHKKEKKTIILAGDDGDAGDADEAESGGRSRSASAGQSSEGKRAGGSSSRKRSGSRSRRDEAERGSVAVAVQTNTPSGKSTGESVDVQAKNNKRNGPINNLQFRYESHDGDAGSVDSVFTAVVSSTRIHNETLITLFGLYNAIETDRDDDYRNTRVGINYTRFYRPTEYGSASYSLPLSDNNDNSTRGSFFFAYNWILSMRGDRTENSYYRLAASYATDEDFDEGKSGTISLDYYMNLRNKTRWNAGYDYIYSFDVDEHIYNQYTLEYTLPWRKQEKVTLGYRIIDREYGVYGNGDDRDEVFRAIYTITY